jgi:hypothetical protein
MTFLRKISSVPIELVCDVSEERGHLCIGVLKIYIRLNIRKNIKNLKIQIYRVHAL